MQADCLVVFAGLIGGCSLLAPERASLAGFTVGEPPPGDLEAAGFDCAYPSRCRKEDVVGGIPAHVAVTLCGPDVHSVSVAVKDYNWFSGTSTGEQFGEALQAAGWEPPGASACPEAIRSMLDETRNGKVEGEVSERETGVRKGGIEGTLTTRLINDPWVWVILGVTDTTRCTAGL